MKVLALYLPQFHRIPENDEWWGEGFTEWTAVKKGKSLFEGHFQPRIPQNGAYYDLTQKDTFVKQTDQVKRTGIDGVCIYHYWFKDGRKVLEKPAELLLKWEDVQLPFCFSWANETWARTWSNLSNRNVWTSEFNNKAPKGQDVLLEQKYGNYNDWKEHFMYLLPFFKDKRYITIDGKPVFAFYRPDDIPDLANMVKCWRELAVQNDLNGIYFIGNSTRLVLLNVLDELFVSEPIDVMRRRVPENKEGVKCYDYSALWDDLLNRKTGKKVSVCGFVGYDDTPRRGKTGLVVTDASPDIFEEGMTKLILRNKNNECKAMFINAWNEWGEGMFLEPDMFYGDQFLNSLRKSIEKSSENNDEVSEIKSLESSIDHTLYDATCDRYDRERHINRIMDRWLCLKERNENICSSLSGKRVAIYGYGLLGKHFLSEMEKHDMKPLFVVDRNTDIYCRYPVLSIDDEWPEVDVLVVTATYDYSKVFTDVLSKKNAIEIISLERIIMEY